MQDAQVTETQESALADEPDKLFGVFLAIGEDLGVNPFYLRVAFIVGLLFSPIAMIAAYVALGLVVALSRWLFPDPPAVTAPAAEPAEVADAPEQEREPELIAA